MTHTGPAYFLVGLAAELIAILLVRLSGEALAHREVDRIDSHDPLH